MSGRFAALGNLDDTGDMKRAWKGKKNIKILVKASEGNY